MEPPEAMSDRDSMRSSYLVDLMKGGGADNPKGRRLNGVINNLVGMQMIGKETEENGQNLGFGMASARSGSENGGLKDFSRERGMSRGSNQMGNMGQIFGRDNGESDVDLVDVDKSLDGYGDLDIIHSAADSFGYGVCDDGANIPDFGDEVDGDTTKTNVANFGIDTKFDMGNDCSGKMGSGHQICYKTDALGRVGMYLQQAGEEGGSMSKFYGDSRNENGGSRIQLPGVGGSRIGDLTSMVKTEGGSGMLPCSGGGSAVGFNEKNTSLSNKFESQHNLAGMLASWDGSFQGLDDNFTQDQTDKINKYVENFLSLRNLLAPNASPLVPHTNSFSMGSSLHSSQKPTNNSAAPAKDKTASARFPTLSNVLQSPLTKVAPPSLNGNMERLQMPEMFRKCFNAQTQQTYLPSSVSVKTECSDSQTECLNSHKECLNNQTIPTESASSLVTHIKVEPLDEEIINSYSSPTTVSQTSNNLQSYNGNFAKQTPYQEPVKMDTTFSDLIKQLMKKAEQEMQTSVPTVQESKGRKAPNSVVKSKGTEKKVKKKKSNTEVKPKKCKNILKIPEIKITCKKEPGEPGEGNEGKKRREKKKIPRPEDSLPIIPMEHFINKVEYVKEEILPEMDEKELADPLLPLGLYEDKVKIEQGETTQMEQGEATQMDLSKPCTCNICHKVFRLYSDLEYHLRCHFGTRNFRCEECGKTFKMRQHLRKHQNVHSVVKPFTCDIGDCRKSFKDKPALKKHMHTHKTEKSYFCDICGKGFVSRLNLKNHKVIHLPDRPFKCQYCHKGFNKNANLKHHLKVHFGFKPFPCSYCDKTFPDKNRWKMHERIHWEDKPYKCTICPAQFAQVSNWRIHLKKHSGEKPFECEVCGKRYLLKSYLRLHMKRHLGMKEFKCAVCGKEYYQRGEFNRHMRTHTGEKTHWCLECNEGFIDKAGYNAHQRAKHGGEMYKCEHCGKEFLHNSNLSRHIETVHTKLKKHFCEKCGVGFLFQTDLRSHLNRHEGFKPHACDICGKRFYKTSVLNLHRKIHTGEVRFCEVCKRTFHYESSYQKHLTTERHRRKEELLKKGDNSVLSDTFVMKNKKKGCKVKKGSEKKSRYTQDTSSDEGEIEDDWLELDQEMDQSETEKDNQSETEEEDQSETEKEDQSETEQDEDSQGIDSENEMERVTVTNPNQMEESNGSD